MASAERSFQSGVGSVIDIKFTKAGLAAFNALAKRLYETSSPQNQIAIVVDGEAVSNPAFQTPTFKGDVQVSGGFSPTEASVLAGLIDSRGLFAPLKVKRVSP